MDAHAQYHELKEGNAIVVTMVTAQLRHFH